MGLLDMMDDPLTAGALGLLAASGPSRMPVSLGQALGSGYQALQGQKDNLMNREMMGFKKDSFKLQMDELKQQQLQRQQQQQILQNFRNQLPEEVRPMFDLDPTGFIKQLQKQEEEYTLTPGAARFKGGQMIAQAPADPNKMSRREELEFQSQLRRDEKEFAARLAASNRQPTQPNLVQVDVNGQPQFVPVQQAIGMKPWNDKTTSGPQKGSPEKRAQEAMMAMPIIEQAEKLLDQATGSYVGSGLDSLARSVGMSTKGAQAAAQLKILEAQLIQNMPRMEGPQSDKDVQLYKQAAAQIGDDTVPAGTKRAALNTLREIQSRYAGMATGGQSASGTIRKYNPATGRIE